MSITSGVIGSMSIVQHCMSISVRIGMSMSINLSVSMRVRSCMGIGDSA